MGGPPSVVSTFDKTKLEALVELMVLAADADGEIGDDERKNLAASFESLTDRKMPRAEFDAIASRVSQGVASSGRAARLASVKERLPDSKERTIALELAVRVMAADGIVRTTERELILEAAEALDIAPDRAADLVKMVESGG